MDSNRYHLKKESIILNDRNMKNGCRKRLQSPDVTMVT